MKKEIIKGVGRIVISSSIGTVTGHIVGALVPPQVSMLQKVSSLVGGCIIANYMASKISDEFDEAVDEFFEVF